MSNQAQQIKTRNAPAPSDSRTGPEEGKEYIRPQMRAYFSPDTINEEARTVEVVFGSENPTRMWTWEHGAILESLSFNQKHVRLDRLNSGAPLLDNHQWRFGSVADTVIGVVEKAWAANKKGHAIVRFSKGEKADRVLAMVKEGVLKNISVGYTVDKYEVTRAIEKGELDMYRAVDWEPHEISMVAVPADASAQVRSLNFIDIKESPESAERSAAEAEQREKNEHAKLLQRRRAEIDFLLP